MNQKRKKSRTRLADCGGLLLLLPAGGGRRGDISCHGQRKSRGGETLQKEQPVTAVQSKTIEIAQAEQQRESEKTKEIKEIKEAKETKAQPARKNEQPVFAAPLEGETKVVLAYSTDHAIYDPTLSSIARTHLSAFPRRRGQR